MKLLWDVRRLLMSFALRSSFSHDGSDGGENFSAGDFWCLAACPGIFFTTTCEHRLNLHYKQGAHLNGHLLLAKRERRRPQFTNVTTYSNSSCLLLAPTAIWNVEKRNLLPYTLANVTFVFGVFFNCKRQVQKKSSPIVASQSRNTRLYHVKENEKVTILLK